MLIVFLIFMILVFVFVFLNLILFFLYRFLGSLTVVRVVVLGKLKC